MRLDVLRRYRDHLWLEHFRILPVVREFATGTRDARRHFLTSSSSNTNEYVRYTLIFENPTLWIIRIQAKMSCVVKNGFYAAQVIYIHYRVVQSDNTLDDSKRATGTLDSGVVWNLFICSNTDAYVRFLRVFWMTHLKCSVVFDWNTRNGLSMKLVCDRILAHRWGFQSDSS